MIDFLGHQLKRRIIGLNEDNVEKSQNAPRPSNKKQVRSFMGLAEYCRDFISIFVAISDRLSNLTCKGQPIKVDWGDTQEKAYQTP